MKIFAYRMESNVRSVWHLYTTSFDLMVRLGVLKVVVYFKLKLKQSFFSETISYNYLNIA